MVTREDLEYLGRHFLDGGKAAGIIATMEEDRKLILAQEVRIKALEQELESKEDRLDFLSCLEAAGVDNWSGYGYAQDMRREQNEDGTDS